MASSIEQLLRLLQDPDISEIMINNENTVFYEKNGLIQSSELKFESMDHVLSVIQKLAKPAGGSQWTDLIVSARMADGSRLHVVNPPIVIGGAPSITIRKFLPSKLNLKNLVKSVSLSEEMAFFLNCCVRARLNIVVSGGTSSGKTSLLNALSTCIDPIDRIITIEDTPELRIQAKNIVRLESQTDDLGHSFSMRELLQSALRMRPDRIIIGETRGPEAFDMLQAMNTGHEGSMTTLHANSPRDCLSRIETMGLTANVGLPLEALRRQMASAIDLIVQLEKLRDGRRVVQSVTEVCGMEGVTILTQEIFCYRSMGSAVDKSLLGKFEATGIVPRCLDKFKKRDIEFPSDFFSGRYHVSVDLQQTQNLPAVKKLKK